MMIMGLALLIYALAERQLRLALAQNNATIQDQKGKPTPTPTIRWVFQIFEGIDLLSIRGDSHHTARQILNLRPVHQQVIHLFGSCVAKCYLLDR
jgi:transposase